MARRKSQSATIDPTETPAAEPETNEAASAELADGWDAPPAEAAADEEPATEATVCNMPTEAELEDLYALEQVVITCELEEEATKANHKAAKAALEVAQAAVHRRVRDMRRISRDPQGRLEFPEPVAADDSTEGEDEGEGEGDGKAANEEVA